jgi:hypothetical protein
MHMHNLKYLLPLAAFLVSACGSDELSTPPEGLDPQIAPAKACSGKCDGVAGLAPLAELPKGEFATLFSPSEPALRLDITLIEKVKAARQADPAKYEEGKNPYTIRYAVYNLRNSSIVSALADAADKGVDVQILIEKDQLDPARDWNVTDEFLIERGFEFVKDHRDLDAQTKQTADLIGISGGGLMHLKARLYYWNDKDGKAQRRLVTGSMNPGDLAVNNEETLHYINNSRVFDLFEAKYMAVLNRKEVTNKWDDKAPINVLFTPDGGVQASDRIAKLIDQEQELILLAVYSFRDIAPRSGGEKLVARLVKAHKRGVKVVMITDRKQSDGVDSNGDKLYYDDWFEERLRDAGISVIEVINPSSQYNAMHTKYGVFGLTNPIVVTDAANWTAAGLGNGKKRAKNDESVLFIDSNALDGGVTATRYLGNFITILRRYSSASNGHLFHTGDTSFHGEIVALQALAKWPKTHVTFNAIASTFWGQSAYITGQTETLGDWAQRGFGIALSTDANNYPSWYATVPLPLGAIYEYKVIKVAWGQVTWESGGNHVLTVDPTLFSVAGVSPKSEMSVSSTFRY